MEQLIRQGFIQAVADITTTEMADELVGGILSAGPRRLEAAAEMGLPQVISVGAIDMVNFGPPDSIADKFRGRTFYRHNPSVTLMRITKARALHGPHDRGESKCVARRGRDLVAAPGCFGDRCDRPTVPRS